MVLRSISFLQNLVVILTNLFLFEKSVTLVFLLLYICSNICYKLLFLPLTNIYCLNVLGRLMFNPRMFL